VDKFKNPKQGKFAWDYSIKEIGFY